MNVRDEPMESPGFRSDRVEPRPLQAAGVAVLYGHGRLSVADATAAVPDLLLAVLFLVAFTMSPKFKLPAAINTPTSAKPMGIS